MRTFLLIAALGLLSACSEAAAKGPDLSAELAAARQRIEFLEGEVIRWTAFSKKLQGNLHDASKSLRQCSVWLAEKYDRN